MSILVNAQLAKRKLIRGLVDDTSIIVGCVLIVFHGSLPSSGYGRSQITKTS